MRKRIDKPIGLQAFYTVDQLLELARAPVSRRSMVRLLENSGIEFLKSGRSIYVPITELQEKTPRLWDNILAVIKEREDS